MKTETWYKVSIGCPARDIDVRLELVEVYAETEKCVRTIAVLSMWPEGFKRLEKVEHPGCRKFFRNFEEAKTLAVHRAVSAFNIQTTRRDKALKVVIDLFDRESDL